MKSLIPLLLLLALIAAPKQIWGQTAATIAQPNDPVKFAELAGSVIEARVVRDQIIRREGRTFPTRLQNDIELVIGPDDRIQQTITPTSDTPRGRRVGRTRTGVFTLEKPHSLRGLGGGDGVYIFEDAVLTFLRTYKEGAFKRTIAFSRSSGGLSCAADEAFVREEGVGDLTLNSGIDDVPVILVSYKQLSSTCRVIKQSDAPTANDTAVGAAPDKK
jgi:hypothetical protein